MNQHDRHSIVARDLMQTEVVTVQEDLSLAELCDTMQQAHIHGAPVVTADGDLLGFVSQEDVLYGSMSAPPPRDGAVEDLGDGGMVTRVRDIMTAPAVSATPETEIEELCRIMWRLRVHHIPIVDRGKVIGIVSSLDLCRAIAERKIKV
jgi:CBS domain-containing protein